MSYDEGFTFGFYRKLASMGLSEKRQAEVLKYAHDKSEKQGMEKRAILPALALWGAGLGVKALAGWGAKALGGMAAKKGLAGVAGKTLLGATKGTGWLGGMASMMGKWNAVMAPFGWAAGKMFGGDGDGDYETLYDVSSPQSPAHPPEPPQPPPGWGGGPGQHGSPAAFQNYDQGTQHFQGGNLPGQRRYGS